MRKVTESNEMGDKNSNAKGVSPHLIKKPLPVKIVEALGWVYALLLSLGVVVGIATAYRHAKICG